MTEIVISEFMDEVVVTTAFAGRDVLFEPGLADDRERLLAAVSDARALIVRNRTLVDEELLAAAPKLVVVGRLGVGLDNIDTEACNARGVTVCPATGANDLSVAEYVVTAALVLLRGAWSASREVAAGEWPRMTLIGREAAGKQAGLVGFGAIARETATRLQALGMNVVASDPYVPHDSPSWGLVKPVSFDALLGTSDVISLHVPLTDETRGLIGSTALGRVKPGAVLINAARGGIVDEGALVAALKSGRLGGAALDVFETEPLTGDAADRLAGVQNLILTPHIAGVTEESNLRVSNLTAANVLRHLE